jgi:iron complex outermembrane receptor protein
MTLLRSGLLVATSLTTLLAVPAWAQAADAQVAAAQDGEPAGDIVVTGIRAALNNAINVKRNADAVVDVITAEGIGKFPDRNVAESLSHIPGVSVDRQFGIGERVSIQGTDPALNRVMIDGHTIASADWGGNSGDVTGRTFNYSLLAPEIVSQIEVFKSPEPRIDEGSLGGTVIVRTRKPLDLEANTINGSVGYNYNDRSDLGNPRGSLLYSWKNDAGTFGILVAGTYDKDSLARAGVEYFGYNSGSDFFEKVEDANGDQVLARDAAGNPILKNPGATVNGGSLEDLANARYPYGINHAYFKQTRERIGGQFALQWAPTSDLEFDLTGLHIEGTYNNFSQSQYIVPGWASGSLESATVANGLVTDASFGSTTLPSTSSQLDMNYRKTKVRTDSYNLASSWKANDSLTLSGNAGWTKATGGTNPEYLMNLQSNVPFSYSYSQAATSVNYGASPTDPTTFFRSAEGQSSGRYQIGGIATSRQLDKEYYGQLDATWEVRDSFFKSVRMGVKASNHVNSLTATGSQVYLTDYLDLSGYDYTLTPSGLFSGLGSGGNATQFATLRPQDVIDTLNSGEYVDTGLDEGSSFQVREKTASAYVQLNFETGPIRGNIGYRAVYTQDISDYYLYTAESDSYAATRAKNDYLKGLPSINVSWDVNDQIKVRGSVAKVIARPRYGQLAGAFSRNDTQLTASGGNPDLKPYSSTNYELSAEWYFGNGALFSAEYFRREISSYIVTTTSERELFNNLTQENATYTVSSPINASNATVNGVSVGFQTPIWGGFGILTNYTFADASGGTGANGEILNLPYLSRHTINVIPYFEKGGFQARVSWNYRSHYFTGVGRLNSVDSTDKYHQLDASVSYKLNEHFTIQANAQNLLDSTYYSYSGTKAAPTAFYKNGRVFAGAIQFAF